MRGLITTADRGWIFSGALEFELPRNAFCAHKTNCARSQEAIMAKKAKKPAAAEKDFDIPLAETLDWIQEGEKKRDGWAVRSGRVAKKMTESLEKHLKKLRKQAEKLQRLSAKQKKRKLSVV
jgi:hypothetical protein